MRSDELMRKLRRVGDFSFEPKRGKGGHIQARREGEPYPDRLGRNRQGLLNAILKQLGLTIDDLR